jgi:hypothetical protein
MQTAVQSSGSLRLAAPRAPLGSRRCAARIAALPPSMALLRAHNTRGAQQR